MTYLQSTATSVWKNKTVGLVDCMDFKFVPFYLSVDKSYTYSGAPLTTL